MTDDIIRAARMIAIYVPTKTETNYKTRSVVVPLDLINELRAALNAAGIDWAQVRKLMQLEKVKANEQNAKDRQRAEISEAESANDPDPT